MRDLLSIGHFAELTGLTVKALRLYDRRGLLRPATVDMATGYRYYSPGQVYVARRIHLLRSLHMPLDDIQALLQSTNSAEAEKHLERHRRRMRERLAETRRVVDLIPTVDRWNALSGEENMVTDTDTIRCSFCGKPNGEVPRVIAGPNKVYICSECVTLCNQVIAKAEEESRQKQG